MRVQVHFSKPSLTKQSFRDVCDINSIVARHRKTGLLTHINARPGSFMDCTSSFDYQTALNKVISADEAFEALPSSLRSRFGNSPAKLLDFLGDPQNLDEAVSLGLVVKPAPAGSPPTSQGAVVPLQTQ